MYLDETGCDGIGPNSDPLLRLVGIIVDETQIKVLESEMKDLANEYLSFLPRKFEFHGNELWGGGGIWSGLEPTTLIEIYEGAISLINKCDIWVTHASINKLKLNDRYPGEVDARAYRLALQFLLEKIDLVSDGHLQIIHADENKNKKLKASEMFSDLLAMGYGEVPGKQLNTVIGSLNFVRSYESPGVQLADLIAFVLQRAENKRDSHKSAAEAISRMQANINSRLRTWRETWPA